MITEKELARTKERYSAVYLNPLTPLSFLKRSERVFPKKTAVVYRDRSFTWEEFADRNISTPSGVVGMFAPSLTT